MSARLLDAHLKAQENEKMARERLEVAELAFSAAARAYNDASVAAYEAYGALGRFNDAQEVI